MAIKRNIYYNGNPNIKKAGVKQEYTKEELEEYIICRNDPEYFIRKYIKIVSLDDGLVLFEMRDYQANMVKTFDENRFAICLLPRQMGKTITVAAYLLHYAIFNSVKSIGILANKGATAREILSRLQRMIENLPFFLQPGVVEFNKGSVEFGNGSKVLAESTSNDAIRGYSFNIVYLDEFAFVENAEDFYTSTYPVISSGKKTKVIVTSTPNGMNLFYKMWIESTTGKNRFVSIKVHWSEHPDRDEAWKQETIANTSQKQFDQEYECSFFGSSGTLIDGKKLAELVWKDPLKESDKIRVWAKPQKDRVYITTCDVSEGVGSDYSVANVIDITEMPYRTVCMFRDNRTVPIEFTEIIERLATKYNESYILVETNNVGSQIGTMLFMDYEYENVILTTTKNQDNYISGGFAPGSFDYGLRTTKKSKRIGCSNLKTLIESDLFILDDFYAISELMTFVKTGVSYEAEEGKFDDIVMTLVVFAWLTTQEYFKDLLDQDVRKQTMESRMSQVEEDLTPFGFVNDGGVDAMNSDDYGILGPDDAIGMFSTD